MIDLKKKDSETNLQYIWRVCEGKNNGLISINWQELADILNNELYDDEVEYQGESAFRKGYQYAKMYYDEVFSKWQETDVIDILKQQTVDLKKERYRLVDERAEYNKNIRNDARLEDRLDKLEKHFIEYGTKNYLNDITIEKNIDSDNDLLVLLSDLHIGQCFDNCFGKYNTEIAISRISEYLQKIIEIADRHKSQNCFVSIQGDLISNSIHKSIAVTNRENVIEQIKIASELITSFVFELSKVFESVYVTSVSGNHSRLEKKEDALKDERLDDLAIWYMKSSLTHIENVYILDKNIDNTIAIMNIRGKEYVNVHGDYDGFSKNGVTNLSMMLGYFPYAITFGHLHTCSFTEEGGIKLIRSGCFAGSGDDYTIEKRLTGKPSQMVCVCTEKGVETYYTIELT